MRLVLLALFSVSSMTGCGPPAIKGGFDSANPAARMYALEHAAEQGDTAAVPRIVEALHADDPAVRLLAIGSLQRLTGETYGFVHYDSPARRDQAVARWVQAVQSGELDRVIAAHARTTHSRSTSSGG